MVYIKNIQRFKVKRELLCHICNLSWMIKTFALPQTKQNWDIFLFQFSKGLPSQYAMAGMCLHTQAWFVLTVLKITYLQ